MERKMKFYPSQFEDCLRSHKEPITKKRLADEVGCSMKTVGKKIKQLRKDGLAVLPGKKGLVIREHVDNFPQAKDIIECGNWLVKMFVGMTIIARVAQKPLLQAAKIALKKLTSDEKHLVKEMMTKLTYFTSTAEVEGLLEEGEKEGGE